MSGSGSKGLSGFRRCVSWLKNQIGVTPRVSLVVACYNVEPYIDDFFESVFSQDSTLRCFEIIAVNDGSTDGTAGKIANWVSKYPDYIRVIHQNNSGAAAARNSGLKWARGDWVGFPDPDDFFSENYFSTMLAEISHPHQNPLLAVCSNLVYYREATDVFSDTHPLRFRFAKGVRRLGTDEMGNHVHLSGASIWIRRDRMPCSETAFDKKVRPAFEDAHFVNRVFVSNPGMTVSFLPEAVYYYRKREAKNSLLDNSFAKEGFFTNKVRFGLLDLLDFSKTTRGYVPRYIQRTCLYDLVFAFRRLIEYPEIVEHLGTHGKEDYKAILGRIFEHIDKEIIDSFSLAGCTEEHRVALLSIFKGERPATPKIYVRQQDPDAGIVQFSYYVGGPDEFTPTVFIDGREVTPILPSSRRTTFLDHTYFRQKFFWIVLDENEKISFEVEGVACQIRHGRHSIGEFADRIAINEILYRQSPEPDKLDSETLRLRDYVRESAPQFRGGMVLMDREDRAGDNAEHLYRYLLKSGRAHGARFVLSKSSIDWDRLQKDGFDLLDYGSDDHIAAQLNADVFAASHIDQNVLWPVRKASFADLARFEVAYLQHGVKTKDVVRRLNLEPIRLFVTAMKGEADAISDPGSNYSFTLREVIFTGFPRHDSLVARSNEVAADSITILPTWRKYLSELGNTEGGRRQGIPHLSESVFRSQWNAFLNSDRLRDLSLSHGLRVRLVLDPNVFFDIYELEVPDWIETVDMRVESSYQDIYARTRVAVTDYSSAASEVAYLQRPVVYFQVDAEEIMKGDHLYDRGCFDFERDGFGPVVACVNDALAAVETVVSGDEDPEYAARRDQRFSFRDGRCCERVSNALDRLRSSRQRHSPLYVSRGDVSKGKITGL